MLFIEESVKNAAKAYVFEPNVSNTWLNMKSMIGSFLNGVWKQGGLAGSVPEDAYSVQVGLGETMTQDDVLNGIMRITVLVAITRPALWHRLYNASLCPGLPGAWRRVCQARDGS